MLTTLALARLRGRGTKLQLQREHKYEKVYKRRVLASGALDAVGVQERALRGIGSAGGGG